MEYSDEECNAKAEAAQREWAYNELCEEVDQLRDQAKDLRSAIKRRDEIIDVLKAEVKRLREKAAIEMSRAWSEERGLKHGSLTIEENHGDLI